MCPMCAQTCILHTHLDRHTCTIMHLHTHMPDRQTQQTLLCVCTHAWSHTCTHMGKSHACMCKHTCMIDHKPPHICARCPCVQTHACVVTHTPTHERCTCLCAHIHLHRHTQLHTHVDTCPCMCACICMDIHESVNTQEMPMHVCTHTNAWSHTCTHMCKVPMCPYTCMHGHTCTHACTGIQTHMQDTLVCRHLHRHMCT